MVLVTLNLTLTLFATRDLGSGPPTYMGGPDEKGERGAVLVQCHVPLGRPFAAPVSLELQALWLLIS